MTERTTKNTAPRDDLLSHRRTQVATIEPKTAPTTQWLWLKDESLEDSANLPIPTSSREKS